MDQKRKLWPKPDLDPNRSATERVAGRIGAALTDVKAVQNYRGLFESRGAFVHGRTEDCDHRTRAIYPTYAHYARALGGNDRVEPG
jgi:hypothetical protein